MKSRHNRAIRSPGQFRRVLPRRPYFALSPRMPANIDELSLSYTLFPRDPKRKMPTPAAGVN